MGVPLVAKFYTHHNPAGSADFTRPFASSAARVVASATQPWTVQWPATIVDCTQQESDFHHDRDVLVRLSLARPLLNQPSRGAQMQDVTIEENWIAPGGDADDFAEELALEFDATHDPTPCGSGTARPGSPSPPDQSRPAMP
jgi:hypothetical protein